MPATVPEGGGEDPKEGEEDALVPARAVRAPAKPPSRGCRSLSGELWKALALGGAGAGCLVLAGENGEDITAAPEGERGGEGEEPAG